ncbi:mitochondrial 37S ribosomal protein YmS-T [Penicillium brasilianum]|uniref:Mitochondrial 37S ribosomal protein YmS-T n=1 Tax=Penicillium brasilianum TaxID=104259 RepID=A0A1S9RRY0_PENBI|nr:mitochondrial 37S ribosomal protein YmS-T [Penicillium brasilianum]
MSPKGNVTTRLNPLRLNTINHLRVRRPNQNEQNACVTVMSSMLNCWASQGYGHEGCAGLEAQLRKCMDAPVRLYPFIDTSLVRTYPLIYHRAIQKSQEKKKNTVNYHLMRMYPKVVGPRKKDGVLG